MDNSRLRFIDAARSVAIILMLQGHFISLTFEDYTQMKSDLTLYGGSGSIWFDIWSHFRGFTAPLFFSITGLVFVYLLTGDKENSFWNQIRVRKGIRRGFTIIFWGYFLQLNVRNISYYLNGHINDRFFAFHVLQSIGLGILLTILLYAIQRRIKIIRFSYLLVLFGFIIFGSYPFIEALGENYFPSRAPQIIQNVIHGRYSIFPISPWIGYVFFGGALGALIRENKSRLPEKWFPFRLILISILFNFFFLLIFNVIDHIIPSKFDFSSSGWFFFRFNEILLFIGILMHLERIVKAKGTFFIMMGQNTLSIYIIHVIILYGALLGIGVRTWIDKSLSFSESILGAILFIIFLGIITYYQPIFIKTFKSLLKKIYQR